MHPGGPYLWLQTCKRYVKSEANHLVLRTASANASVRGRHGK